MASSPWTLPLTGPSGRSSDPAFGLRAHPAPGASPGDPSARPFSRLLREAIEQVNELQHQAEVQAEALARGEVQDLHQLTLVLERARLALDLTVAVRNRLVEAYQEISRMPI